MTTSFDVLKFLPPHKQEKKITLNIQQIITPPAPKAKPVLKPIVKKIIPKQEIETVKRKLLNKSKKVYAQKSNVENNVTKVTKKATKKIVKKPKKRIVKKKIAKKKKRIVKKRKQKRAIKRSSDPLANMLRGSGTSMMPTRRRAPKQSSNERLIKSLYGKEFNTYSPVQKKFIRNNLNLIQQITQRTLSRNGYPFVAIQTKQQGVNTVSFYLHPNGDISRLRLKKRIGYASLDDNTIEVINIAYKDYPLPNKKTRLIFYVHYSIY